MIRHILRKDLRLLWALVLVLAAIELAAACLRMSIGLYPVGLPVVMVRYLGLLSLIGVAVLTMAMMYQDPLLGVRQDWLIRPIRRGHLIIAKLLFLMVFILGPVLLVDLGECLADGFGLRASLGASVGQVVALLFSVGLPMMMLGAVTRSITELFVVAAAGIIVIVALHLLDGVAGTGLDWMVSATWYAFALVGAAVVICLQYFRRQTALARCLMGAGAGAVLLSAFLPWHTAFSLQERLSKDPSSASRIVLAFSPQLGSFKVPRGAAVGASRGVYVPLRVSGVPTDAIVLMDRANVRITDMGGKTLYEDETYAAARGIGGVNAGLEVRQTGHDDAPIEFHQRIRIPEALYAKLSNQPVRMQIDYSLTLFRAAATHSIPATNGHEKLEGFGRCATNIDTEGDDVQLRCLNTDGSPRCLTAYLEYTPSGLRNPETHRCFPWYNPFPMEFGPNGIWGALDPVGLNAAFFDRSGLTHYPVDGSKIADSRLVIETYEPRDHFTRQLNIPAIRLADFIAVPAEPTAPL
jgi:hypothetical protein